MTNNYHITESYYQSLYHGAYGGIKSKHIATAEVAKRKNLEDYQQLEIYIDQYTKYDEWSPRDIDKTIAAIKFIIKN